MTFKRLLCHWFGHKRDVRAAMCTRCRMTDEALEAGRDKPPTWADVDAAYALGWNHGSDAKHYEWRKRRRRYVQIGKRLMLRSFENTFPPRRQEPEPAMKAHLAHEQGAGR